MGMFLRCIKHSCLTVMDVVKDIATNIGSDGSLCLLTDTLETEGLFFVIMLIKSMLDKGRPVIVLCIERPFTAYQAGLKKLGSNPSALQDRGLLLPIVCLASASSPSDPIPSCDLQPAQTIDRLRSALQTSSSLSPPSPPPFIVLDTVTAASGLLGSPAEAYSALCRGAAAVAARADASLLVWRHGAVSDEEGAAAALSHTADWLVNVRPLDTGRSADVQGQLEVRSRVGGPEMRARRYLFKWSEGVGGARLAESSEKLY